MVGVGAIAGTLSGGYTNAARSPGAGSTEVAADDTPVVQAPAVARAGTVRTVRITPPESASSNTTTVAMSAISAAQAAPAPQAAPAQNAAPAPSGPAPSAVIAMRFPSNWQQQAQRPGPAAGDNDAPPLTMAYAAEPQRAQTAPPAAAPSTGGYALASVDTNPRIVEEPATMPKRMAKPEKPKPPVLFNDAQLASIKARLRLTRDQEAHWPRVEEALRAISWKIATQSRGIVSGKQQAQMIDPNSPEVARLKSAAFPLIMSMREDQKQEVRQLAHTMGLKQVATMF
jgi:hypothetical protein